MSTYSQTGILLINTGSPAASDSRAVRRYLRQFLSDPRVIDMRPLSRWLLLNLIILPRRPKQSADAYRSIWTERGSPLIVNSEDFRDALRERLPDALVEIGMAYGDPSVPAALEWLVDRGAARIIVAPMFPQYASATVGAVLELVYRTAGARTNVPAIRTVRPFYNAPEFHDAWAAVAKPDLDAFAPDHVLMSYHGLPERHIFKGDPTGAHCLQRSDCCETYLEEHPDCYRAHCMATTRGIAGRLGLSEGNYTVAFQSKLGREPWLEPPTHATVVDLARTGVKRLAILSPAFVADCVETLEEIGIQARDAFLKNGGEAFLLVPSLNNHPAWVNAFSEILERC